MWRWHQKEKPLTAEESTLEKKEEQEKVGKMGIEDLSSSCSATQSCVQSSCFAFNICPGVNEHMQTALCSLPVK